MNSSLRINKWIGFILLFTSVCISWRCGIYSLTGAAITGKTINIRTLENRAPGAAPTLTTVMTDKLRNRILSQTGLAAVNNEEADYDMKGVIISYQQSNSGISTNNGVPQTSLNRLSITVEVNFTNRKEEKSSFKQSFTRFADFEATKLLQSEEARLIEEISNQIADDIFNKAFVNW
jgi:hypothetical protein